MTAIWLVCSMTFCNTNPSFLLWFRRVHVSSLVSCTSSWEVVPERNVYLVPGSLGRTPNPERRATLSYHIVFLPILQRALGIKQDAILDLLMHLYPLYLICRAGFPGYLYPTISVHFRRHWTPPQLCCEPIILFASCPFWDDGLRNVNSGPLCVNFLAVRAILKVIL